MQSWNKNKVTPLHQKATSVEPSATFPVGWTNHALGVVTFPVGWASGFLAHAADVCMANSVGKSKTNLPTLHTHMMATWKDVLTLSTPEQTPTIKKTPRSIQNATAKAMLVLSLTTGALAPVQAQEPTTSSVSATAPSDKGGWQMVQLQDGRKMSFREISLLQGKEKEDIINKMTDEGYSEYDKYIESSKQAANQRIWDKKEVEQAANQRKMEEKTGYEAANQTEQEIDTALNQQEALKNLLNTLFDTQGLSVWNEAIYRSQASIVTAVLVNPLARPKQSDTVEFLQNIEAFLKNGKNPFAYISEEEKNKLKSMIN
mgnify:CR=1 FL=1